MILAAIGVTPPTRVTMLAVEVRLNGTWIPCLQVINACPHFNHFHPQFMPRDSRVREERHLSQIAANVSPTDSNSSNTNQHLARAR
jgi:hypothetical protein